MRERTELPMRRMHLTQSLPWRGGKWLFTVGFDALGRAREIFLVVRVPVDGGLQGLAAELAITVSHMLQSGSDALALAIQMRHSAHAMAPLLRLVLLAAARMQREDGPAIREAYLCAQGDHPRQRCQMAGEEGA
jgi:hypothetical protein